MAEIVERDMPGYRVAEPGDEPAGDALDAARAAPEAATPDVEELRRKYFGEEAIEPDQVACNPGPDETGTDEEIVHLVPTDSADPWDRAKRPKAIVFSHRERKVVGYQG